MVDDTTEREVAIPAVYILGKNGSVKLCWKYPIKISSKLFQAHDQKNPCPAGEGQCLGEHSSKHQQNCSPPTQSTSMAGVVKRIGNLPPLENYSEVLISMFVWVVCFWRGTVPWWTYQWTSAELLPANSINLHGWCGEELWKEKEKVTLLKNYSEMLMFFVCLSCLCLSLLSPLLSTLMCLVYASGSAMKRNLQV